MASKKTAARKPAPKKAAPKKHKAKVAKPAKKAKPAAKRAGPAQAAKAKPAKPPKPAKVAKAPKAAPPPAPAPKASGKKAAAGKPSQTRADSQPAVRRDLELFIPPPDRPVPRATKLPGPAEVLTKREMEQVLTVAAGRGVQGEGSLKGLLVVHRGFPYLEVIGRDKRELYFMLQGPDQEVLPAYLDHKVSVSGLVRKTHNHGGTVDVRKYSAKKPEVEVAAAPEPVEDKLRYLSPGEVEQVSSPGMGAGMKGFASIRGVLEMAGDEFFLVVSNAGTRQQVSFILDGKGAKGQKRSLGHVVQVTGVIEKNSGWGGRIHVESCEPRSTDFRGVVRDHLRVVEVESSGSQGKAELVVNQGLSVRLPERVGYTWAVEPTVAKRVSLRETNFEHKSSGPSSREFFFTPRVPGLHEIEFFLAKAFNPLQVQKSWRLSVDVKDLGTPA